MQKPSRKRPSVPRPLVEKGEELDAVILRPVRRPLTRGALQAALGPAVRAWLRAACIWDDLEIGDYRFVVFSFSPAPNVQVFVQFWSEPLEPVTWEVSSGRWHAPRQKWLAGRDRRIEAFGFTIAEGTENYSREVRISSAADVTRAAREVVNIFYDAFDYRGLKPLTAKLVHEGRSVEQPTYDAFTPEDVSKLFAASGFRVEEPITDDEDVQEPPMIRCRKRGMFTIVEFIDQVEDENLFRRVRFSAEFKVTEEQARAFGSAPDASTEGVDPVLSVSVVHAVGGGVGLAWMVQRIGEWDALLTEHRRELRTTMGARALQVSETVH
jgi:hypothetical protein